MRAIVPFLIGLCCLAPPLNAQDPKSAPAPEPELTVEERQERDARKSCKVAICAALHNRKPGPDISCAIVKSWRKEQLDKLIAKAKTSWPWGRVRCTGNIMLKRSVLIKAMTERAFEMQLDPHHVTCEVERGQEGDAQIRFDIAPKVWFANGRAVKASLNWGKIEAPSLVKGAMWTATVTDNTFNVLQSTVVDDVNDFVASKCLEVKDEWETK